MNAIFIHGTYGNPEENWFPWLKRELQSLGISVYIPKFPTPRNQSLKNWLKTLKEHEQYIDEESIIVAHSVGCAFALHLIEKRKIKAAFLVAGFTGKLANPKIDKLNKPISERKFDFKKINKNCSKFLVYSSDDDPYVPLEKGEDLAYRLETCLTIIPKAGHFNDKSGYLSFEKLLSDIRNLNKLYK